MPVSFKRKRREKERVEVVTYTHFEEVLARVRPFGPYQIFCCIVILYASIEWAGNATFMDSLGSVEPDWNCTLYDGTTVIVPADMDTNTKCRRLENDCKDFHAQRDSVEFHSLRAHFKLICKDDNKVMWIQVITATGAMLGSLVGGHLGDFFGRQTIFFIGQLLILISSMMATAAQGWLSFALIMLVNCVFFGLLETTTLTMMMEYTSNKYRLILAACFQWPIAYMVLALIALLTKDWQNYFVFINLVASPLAIGFMLFLESPRWLIARNELDRACDLLVATYLYALYEVCLNIDQRRRIHHVKVLNDMSHERWNNTKAKFTTRDLSTIHKTEKKLQFYNLTHLFKSRRLMKQTIMQLLSTFTYAIVSNTYLYTTRSIHSNAVMYTFLDGLFRLFTPVIIIFLDYRFRGFGRKLQFIGSLSVEAILFAVVILLIACGISYKEPVITILIIVSTMINDCVFWLNIIQITTQRYPTVIRCIAFGFIHAVKHFGLIVGVVAMQPLLTSWTMGAFIIPEILILITLITGIFIQPETKGKALMDQMVEGSYGRVENEIPKALIKLAAGHKVNQISVRRELRKELEAHEEALNKGIALESPWIYKGESVRSSPNPSYTSYTLHGMQLNSPASFTSRTGFVPSVKLASVASIPESSSSTEDTEVVGIVNKSFLHDIENGILDDVADDDEYVDRVSREPTPLPERRATREPSQLPNGRLSREPTPESARTPSREPSPVPRGIIGRDASPLPSDRLSLTPNSLKKASSLGSFPNHKSISRESSLDPNVENPIHL